MLYIVCLFHLFNIFLYSSPQIHIKNISNENFYDWGKITPDNVFLYTSFPVLNLGNDTLIIEDILPGCACTQVDYFKNKIPPGDSILVNVKFNTKGFKGNVSKNITIISNDPINNRFYIFLKMYIEYPIAFSPNEYIIFLNTIKNKTQTQALELINTTDKNITILEARSSDSSFIHNIKNNTVLKPKEKIKVVIKFTANSNEIIRAGITIKTDYNAYPFTRIFLQSIPKKQ